MECKYSIASLKEINSRFRRLEDNYGVLSKWTLDKIKEASKNVCNSDHKIPSDSSVLAKFLTKVLFYRAQIN